MSCYLIYLAIGVIVGLSIKPYRRHVQREMLKALSCPNGRGFHEFGYLQGPPFGLLVCEDCGVSWTEATKGIF